MYFEHNALRAFFLDCSFGDAVLLVQMIVTINITKIFFRNWTMILMAAMLWYY